MRPWLASVSKAKDAETRMIFSSMSTAVNSATRLGTLRRSQSTATALAGPGRPLSLSRCRRVRTPPHTGSPEARRNRCNRTFRGP